jgi:hypothetical protein
MKLRRGILAGLHQVSNPWYLAGGVLLPDIVGAYDAIAAPTYAIAKLNLLAPGTHDLDDEGTHAPDWDRVLGFQGDGVGKYLTTDITPPNTSYTIVCEFNHAVENADISIMLGSKGASGGTLAWYHEYKYLNKQTTAARYGATATYLNDRWRQGMLAFTADNIYMNGRLIGTIANKSAPTAPIHLLAYNENGTTKYFTLGNVTRFAIYLRPLILTEITNLYDATQPTLIDLTYGSWCWFQDPRAVYYNGKSYICTANMWKEFKIAEFNHAMRRITASFVLGTSAAANSDDHISPAVLVRDNDKRLLAAYCCHDDSTMRLRISTNPEDASAWGDEVSLDASIGDSDYTYPHLHQLLGEDNDPIYLIYRGINAAGGFGPFWSVSADGGATWGSRVELFNNGLTHCYFKVAQAGDRLHFAVNSHTPQTDKANLHHFYYEAGAYYKSDGTLIEDALPLTPENTTLVHDGRTAPSYGSWVWDIAVDGSGKPVIVFATFPTTSAHKYFLARWTGLAWEEHEIPVTAGGYLYAAEAYYSGGVILDHSDPNTVYVSAVVSGQREIFRCVTADGGATWTTNQITTGSTYKNVRPVVPLNHQAPIDVLWLNGNYVSNSNFDQYVRFA